MMKDISAVHSVTNCMTILVPVGPKKSQYTKLENECITVLKQRLLFSAALIVLRSKNRPVSYLPICSVRFRFILRPHRHAYLFGTL